MPQESRLDIRETQRAAQQEVVFQKDLCDREIIAEIDTIIDFFGTNAQPVHVHIDLF